MVSNLGFSPKKTNPKATADDLPNENSSSILKLKTEKAYRSHLKVRRTNGMNVYLDHFGME